MDRLDKNTQTSCDLLYSKINTIFDQIDSETNQNGIKINAYIVVVS